MHKLTSGLLSGALAIPLMCGLTAGIEAKSKNPKSNAQNMTVTGCLTQDANEKNEYLVKGEDGKTWGLKSQRIKLNQHLNHKVTVTGKVTKGAHESEAGDMNVSTLKMVSDSCK